MIAGRRRRAERGFTLLEVIIAIVVLALGLLSLGATAGLTVRDLNRSRRDIAYWADVQQVADSLLSKGFGAVSAGSATVRGRALSWTLTTVNSKTTRINLLVSRTRYAELSGSVQDTVLLFLSTP
jgi:prepilin-type N-terminal cleavage/methylation domain-containing protein